MNKIIKKFLELDEKYHNKHKEEVVFDDDLTGIYNSRPATRKEKMEYIEYLRKFNKDDKEMLDYADELEAQLN